MIEQMIALDTDLVARFPGFVTADTRKGYQGYLINPENLIEVATAIRDEMGYDYLSSVTGVDYLPEDKLEVVYHAFKSTGGPGLVFKAQTSGKAVGLMHARARATPHVSSCRRL